jgi:hypothetical protein
MSGNRDKNHYDLLVLENILSPRRRREPISPPIKSWPSQSLTEYAFLSYLSKLVSFMVRYSGILGIKELYQSIIKV